MDNNSNYVTLMKESLKKKAEILVEIETVTELQKEILKKDPFKADKFDETVAKKTSLLDEIEKLDNGFETLFERVREVLNTSKEQYADDIREMQQYIKKITELSVSLEADEKRIKDNVTKQYFKIKESAKETRKNSRAVSNYYKTMSKIDSEPQFMDRKK